VGALLFLVRKKQPQKPKHQNPTIFWSCGQLRERERELSGLRATHTLTVGDLARAQQQNTLLASRRPVAVAGGLRSGLNTTAMSLARDGPGMGMSTPMQVYIYICVCYCEVYKPTHKVAWVYLAAAAHPAVGPTGARHAQQGYGQPIELV
jgi:hypothetical protein